MRVSKTFGVRRGGVPSREIIKKVMDQITHEPKEEDKEKELKRILGEDKNGETRNN